MKLIREKLTLNIRKSHDPGDLDPQPITESRPVVKKIPSVATTTRLPLRSSETKTSALTKSQSTTEKKPELTRTSRLSLDSRSSPKPNSGVSAASRLSSESKSLRSSPLDNRTRETLRASTDRLSLDTLSSRNKKRTGELR